MAEQKTYTLYEVIKKFTGGIEPVGSTHIDDKKYENLNDVINLINMLLHDISEVSELRFCPEFSISRAGERAYKFLEEIKKDL